MDRFDLTARMMTAAEFAAVLGVGEDDVLEWMLAGYIAYEDDAAGVPGVRVAKDHEVDGPISSWSLSYPVSPDPAFRAELARRQREHELASLDWGDVDPAALAQALAVRLRAVIPPRIRVLAEGDFVCVLDAQGHGVRIDIALHASFPETESGALRVRSAAVGALEGAQDELTMLTADPWPRQGGGDLPTPRAVLTPDATGLRLLYGDPVNPVLELEQLLIADVLA